MTEGRPAGRSLRARLTRRIVALGLAGSLVTAALVLAVAHRAVSSEVRGRLADLNVSRADALDAWVDERLRDVVLLAGAPDFARSAAVLAADGDASTTELTARLATLREGDELFEELVLERAVDGRVLASTGGTAVGSYLSYPVHLEQGSLGPFIQEVYTSQVDGRPRITVAAPVRRADGDVVAVLAGHLDLTYLEDLLVARPLSRGVQPDIYLVSDAGDFVSANRFGLAGHPPGTTSDGIRLGIAGETGVRQYRGYLGDDVLGAYRWLPERRMALLVEVDAAAAFWPARRVGLLAFLAGLVVSLLVLIGGLSVSRRVAAPLEALAATAAKVTGGEFALALPRAPDAPTEVQRLAEAFRSMVGRLESSFRELEEQVDQTGRALRDAEESRALLQAIMDNSTSIIGVCSREGTIQLANRNLSTLLARDGGDIVGLPLTELLPEELASAVPGLLEQAMRENRVVETEFEVPVENGRRSYLAIVFPLRISQRGDEDVGFIALDRTERLQAEERRASLEGQLQHAQKLESLGVLAGGVAHDFNNLLQVILGHISLLEEEVSSEIVEAYVRPVETAATRAADLTGQLLTYAGKRSLRQERVDVNVALRQLSELIGVTIPKTATFHQDLDPDAGAVRSDPAQVSQILLNLLTNAAEALPDGVGDVRVRTRAVNLGPLRTPDRPPGDELPDGRYVEIVVEDNGVGMDEETMSKVFDPFFSTKTMGRGLGLASVLGIVQGSGGSLRVASMAGRGTTFTVLLPRVTPAARDSRRTRPAAPSLAGMRILVADDEPGVRRFVARALEAAGANVWAFANGRDAVDAFEAEPRDWGALVLDLTMPVMGGVEALELIRASRPEIPTVLCSGYDASGTLANLTNPRSVAFLQKPFGAQDLMNEIVRLCREDDQVAGL